MSERLGKALRAYVQAELRHRNCSDYVKQIQKAQREVAEEVAECQTEVVRACCIRSDEVRCFGVGGKVVRVVGLNDHSSSYVELVVVEEMPSDLPEPDDCPGPRCSGA